jgi:hypothetical protein
MSTKGFERNKQVFVKIAPVWSNLYITDNYRTMHRMVISTVCSIRRFWESIWFSQQGSYVEVKRYGVLMQIVDLIKESYRGYVCWLVHEGCVPEPIPVQNRVRQGCILSRIMFLIVIDAVMRNEKAGWSHHTSFYAMKGWRASNYNKVDVKTLTWIYHKPLTWTKSRYIKYLGNELIWHRRTLYSVNAHDRQSALKYACYLHSTQHYTLLVTSNTNGKNQHNTHTHTHKTAC